MPKSKPKNPSRTAAKQASPETRKVSAGPLAPLELRRMNAYWRAANYLSVGQIYLLDNQLLREPLKLEHIKPRLLGHWAPLRASISFTFISTG